MENPQDGQTDEGKLEDKQRFEEKKLHGEDETAECDKTGNIEIENKEKDVQAKTLNE